jgi:protein-S-isoprenylcysteine O-methyltransferase Ste14
MNRHPFLFIGTAFAAGIGLSRQFQMEPSFWFCALLVLLPLIPF